MYGLNIFDLDNPLKPTPIPTKSGRWHKADTAFEDTDERSEPINRRVSRAESSAALRKYGLFYAGIELRLVEYSPRRSLSCLDPSKKNMKYYLKIALSWICGVEHQAKEDDRVDVIPTMPSLAPENLFWKRICNVNALIIIALSSFLWAFFTDYRIDKMYTSD